MFPLPLAELNVLDYAGPRFLGFYCVAFVIAYAACWAIRAFGRRDRGGKTSRADVIPEPYELAYLSGDGALAMSAALATLSRRGAVNASGNAFITWKEGVKTHHPLEEAIVRALRTDVSRTGPDLYRRVTPALNDLRAGLEEQGWVVDTATAVSTRVLTLLLGLAVPVLGVAKMAVGLSRGKPVLYLAMLIAVSVLAVVLSFWRRLRNTAKGDRVLADVRNRLDRGAVVSEARDRAGRRRSKVLPAPTGPGPIAQSGLDPLTLAIALYGMDVLAGTPIERVRSAAYHQPTSNGNSSNAASNSGCATTSGCSSSPSSCSSSSSSDSSSSSSSSGCGGCSSSSS